MPVSPPQTYLTLSLRHLGFSTFKTNLLSIPSYTFGVIMLIFMALVSEVINSRAGTTIFLQLCILPLLITLYRFTAETSQWAYFAVVTLITGLPYVHPIQVAWTSRNSHSVRTRCVPRFKIYGDLTIKTTEPSQRAYTICASKRARSSR